MVQYSVLQCSPIQHGIVRTNRRSEDLYDSTPHDTGHEGDTVDRVDADVGGDCFISNTRAVDRAV